MTYSSIEHPLVAVDASGPNTAIVLALPGQDPKTWSVAVSNDDARPEAAAAHMLHCQGEPSTETAIICTRTALLPAEDAFDDVRRMQLWKEAIESADGNPLLTLKKSSSQFFSNMLLIDPLAAFAMTALMDDRLRTRCWEEGVTALWAGERWIWILLLFRESICASYEHSAAQDAENIADDLHQIQLNWPPAERVKRSGGSGCFIHRYPPEAEGFRPVYLFGPKRMRFSGMGKMAKECGTPSFDLCRGLIEGFARSKK